MDGDYFILRKLIVAVREQRSPMINVYGAVTWPGITPLSTFSVDQNNNAAKVLDLKDEQ